MDKGDVVYRARIIPTCDVYEVEEIKIRTVCEDWYVGVEESTKQARYFTNKSIGKTIFTDRNKALKIVKEAEKYRIEVNKKK